MSNRLFLRMVRLSWGTEGFLTMLSAFLLACRFGPWMVRYQLRRTCGRLHCFMDAPDLVVRIIRETPSQQRKAERWGASPDYVQMTKDADDEWRLRRRRANLLNVAQ